MTKTRGTDRGERLALHTFGKQAIKPGASAAARAVFEACGGAQGWKGWIVPDGKMTRLALEELAKFFDKHPDAPAEAAYLHLRAFPAFIGTHVSWAEAPMQVRGAYEAFRSVYLQLWILVRTHDETMAHARPPRPLPRLVHSDMMERHEAENSGRMGSRETLSRPSVARPAGDKEELRAKLLDLGYSEEEISSRFHDQRVYDQTDEKVLADAEDDACYRAWCTEQAKTAEGYPSFPEHELRPERTYLNAVYETWIAQYEQGPRLRDQDGAA